MPELFEAFPYYCCPAIFLQVKSMQTADQGKEFTNVNPAA